MKITTNFQKSLIFYLLILLLSLVSGFLFSINDDILPIFFSLLFCILITPIVFNRPKILLSLFMIGFVFGEIGIKINNFPTISFSNLLIMYSAIIITIQILIKKIDIKRIVSNQQKKIILSLFLILFLHTIISSYRYSSFGFISIQIGYFLIYAIFIFLTQKLEDILRYIELGSLSSVFLSVLTILRSADITAFGYRASSSWGLMPWEKYLPRAIGLPQMDGGLFGVFIVIFLPFTIMQALNNKNKLKSLFYKIFSLLDISAIFISEYRSAIIGFLISITLVLFFFIGHVKNKNLIKICFALIIIGVSSFLLINLENVKAYFEWALFDIRGEGVISRLDQYRFAISSLFSNFGNFWFGLGFDKFTFEFGNLDITNSNLGLHNQFISYFYSAGFLAIITYLLIFFITFVKLFSLIKSPNYSVRTIGITLLAGLVGSFFILNLTTRLGNYKILWVVFAFVASAIEMQPNKRGRAFNGTQSIPK